MKGNLYVIEGYSAVEVSDGEKDKFQNKIVEVYRQIFPVHYSKDSLLNFNSALSNYLPWLREIKKYVWEVKNEDYDFFTRHLSNNVRSSTVIHYNCLISNFYDWLISRKDEEIYQRYGVHTVNPIDKWNTPKRKTLKMIYLTYQI
ncbi:MAG: hypothetical protein PHT78_07150 [Desulfitobacteriaceae bacterium]|nr:hypothetical protein [Desulfitobacteriaceae bacterium]